MFSEAVDQDGEMFLIPFLDGYIFYAPRLKQIALVETNYGDELRLDMKQYGYESGMLLALGDDLGFQPGWRDVIASRPSSKDWAPTSVTFSNTQKCTLRCTYCYADGGRLDDADIDVSIADAAIDLVVSNALAAGKQPGVTFLGEGEATANWDAFTHIIEYFESQSKSRGLKPYVQLSTNGIFSENRVPYLAEHCDDITFSVDGIAQAHDVHRVLPNGKGSFNKVASTMAAFDAVAKSYNIRTTATRAATENLNAFIDWVGNNTGCKNIHVEPVFNMNGIAKTAEVTEHPEEKNFVAAFRKARRLAAGYGIEVYYSSSDTRIRHWFCGAYDASNFLVTSKGLVTACNEVMREEDKRSSLFKYGRWNASEGRFDIDFEVIGKLSKLNVHNMPKCQECFAKYNCAGDCYAKSMAPTGDPWSSSITPRCGVTRDLLKDNLAIELISQA